MLEKLTHSWSLAKSRPDVEGQGPPRRGSNASNVSWDNQLVDSPTLGCSPQKRSHSQEFWKDPATYTSKWCKWSSHEKKSPKIIHITDTHMHTSSPHFCKTSNEISSCCSNFSKLFQTVGNSWTFQTRHATKVFPVPVGRFKIMFSHCAFSRASIWWVQAP